MSTKSASPEAIDKALRSGQWDTLTINGRTTALVCPLCGAFVIATKAGDPYSGRERHTLWHVALTEILYGANLGDVPRLRSHFA